MCANSALSDVAFVGEGETITDTALQGRTMAEVLAEKRKWWEEYAEECEAEGTTTQPWKDALTIWRDEAEREARTARAWAVTLSLAIRMADDE